MKNVEDLKANLTARALVINNDLKRYKTLIKEDNNLKPEDKNAILINIFQLQAQKEIIDQIIFEIDDKEKEVADD